jgi:3-dehydrosphinganine reductase
VWSPLRRGLKLANLFDGKLVLITGGSSGIGLSLAKCFVSKGANVWVLARRQDQLEIALDSLSRDKIKLDQKLGCISADVANEGEVAAALEKFSQDIGIPDYLVNSAGVVFPGRFEEIGIDKFRWMMDINYFGAVHTTKAFIKGMIQRHSGHIINIGSGSSFVGIYGYSAYTASKFALRGFTDVLRSEMKPFGIKFSIVFPPDTDTPQLAFELKYKPAITKEITGIVKPLSPDWVAEKVIKGIERNQYVIIPDFKTNILYHAANFLGNQTYRVMDMLVNDAIRKTGFPKINSD